MFTNQVGSFDALLNNLTPDRLVDVLKNTLGQCQASLVHRGDVRLLLDPNRSRPSPAVAYNADLPLFAALQAQNYTGFWGGDAPNIEVDRGLAAFFRGPVRIDANLFDLRRIGLVVNNAIWCQRIYVGSIYDLNGDPYEFGHTYRHEGVTVGTQTTTNLLNGPGYTWTASEDLVNDEIEVSLNIDFGKETTITVNSQVVNASSQTFWIKCQHCWNESGYVTAKVLASYGGLELGTEFNAYFTDYNPADKLPIAYKGQKLLCTLESDGTVRIIDDNAFGPPLGTVRWIARLSFSESDFQIMDGSVNISGWGVQDSAANDPTNYAGSGMDWSTDDGVTGAQYPPIYLYPKVGGVTNALNEGSGGSITHDHTVLTDAGFADLADHPHHRHRFAVHCGTFHFLTGAAEDPGSALGYLLTELEDRHDDFGLPVYTGNELDSINSHTSSDVHEAITLTHEDAGHAHTGDTGGAYQLVHRKSLCPIERVKNSFQQLGI